MLKTNPNKSDGTGHFDLIPAMKSRQSNALGEIMRPFHFLLLLIVGGLAVVLFLASPAASTRTHSVSHECEELQSENFALRQKLALALNRLAKCDADAHPNAVASPTREFLASLLRAALALVFGVLSDLPTRFRLAGAS